MRNEAKMRARCDERAFIPNWTSLRWRFTEGIPKHGCLHPRRDEQECVNSWKRVDPDYTPSEKELGFKSLAKLEKRLDLLEIETIPIDSKQISKARIDELKEIFGMELKTTWVSDAEKLFKDLPDLKIWGETYYKTCIESKEFI